jgi:hypothetical protein
MSAGMRLGGDAGGGSTGSYPLGRDPLDPDPVDRLRFASVISVLLVWGDCGSNFLRGSAAGKGR